MAGGRRLLVELVRFFAPALEVVVLPAWDCLPYDRVSPNTDVMARRLDALARLLDARSPDAAPTRANPRRGRSW